MPSRDWGRRGGRGLRLTAGARVGPYEVLSARGAGGMGEVFRARDTRLGREVALKVISDGAALDPERLQRFEQEGPLVELRASGCFPSSEGPPSADAAVDQRA